MERRYGLRVPFSLAEFHHIRPGGRFSPLDAPVLAELLRAHDDWFLITDIKSDQRDGLRKLCAAVEAAGVSCCRRVIPQLYQMDETDVLDEPGFDRAILTLYRMPRVDGTAIAALLGAHPQIVAVTMPAEGYSEALGLDLRDAGAQVFLHTINDASLAQALFARGASGVYSDVLSDTDLPMH